MSMPPSEQQLAHEALHNIKRCPNCNEWIKGHPENGCALNVLMGVVRERAQQTDKELYKLHTDCDSDALWNDLGEIVDRLQDGSYSAGADGPRRNR